MLVRQAFDGAQIAEIQVDSEASVAEKLDRAARCFANRAGWLPPYRRIEILRRLARLLEREYEALAMLIAREGGKPLTDARIEAARSINGVESAIGDLEHLAGREIPMGLTPASRDRWAFTTKEPIGVVAAISAFNHPLNLIVHQVAPAIAVGCPVIVKPAVATPLSCLEFIALLRDAGLAEAWCQTFVTDYNAGQVCVSTQRIFVHADLLSDFIERFAARVESLRVGDPLLPETEVGPLINPREADRVESWIDEVASAGARLIGGGRRSETTLIPAILLEPPTDAKVSQLEVFG